MQATTHHPRGQIIRNSHRWPLYAAGFTTAFGAHAVAAGLGAESTDIGLSLLGLGVLLALYDVAEVFLKPVFGALSDRVGPKPVIIGGLLAFSAASLIGLWAEQPLMLAMARLGQGMAASAFSPASSSTVARLAGRDTGRYFGRYGSWKGLGYAIGPLLGALAIIQGGFALLFATLAALGLAVAICVVFAVPRLEPLPRPRYTVLDVWRQSTDRSFLGPTLVLAAGTGALGAAVGFLPALAAREGLGTAGSVSVVTVLAVASSLIQPRIGGLRDQGVLPDRRGMVIGLLAIAVGTLIAGLISGVVAIFGAAVLIGAGIGIATPLAFAHLADATPAERLGRTMGSAELGRELGDAGGPLLVGGVAVAAGLPWGLGALALAVGAAALAAPSSVRPGAAASGIPEKAGEAKTQGGRNHI
ncbi:MFS transporter [Paenarthrobacter sp. NPDC089322]|uniref:MFS transporter n=1 Tax=Paenarthrobacter sp. NPDC089322 TaxID=3155065 RepID=UPI00343E358F